MNRDFRQNTWGHPQEQDLKRLLEIAVWEDLGETGDLTSQALIPRGIQGRGGIHVRHPGVIAGLAAVPHCLAAVDPSLKWFSCCKDGQSVEAGTKLGEIVGPVLSIMMAERLILNLLSHLCGVATLTRSFVDAIQGTKSRIYDTRKTTLGWRRLDKYAVCCGGGFNHRTGLFDAVLIKDNHLAFGALPGSVLDSDHSLDIGTDQCQTADSEHRQADFSPAESVRRARFYLTKLLEERLAEKRGGLEEEESEEDELFVGDRIPIIEIEMDTLDHFEDVLKANPDIVLLDNMSPEILREAVRIRDRVGSTTELEASGGITLQTVAEVAKTGVERISVGSLTHSNRSLDIGLDWEG